MVTLVLCTQRECAANLGSTEATGPKLSAHAPVGSIMESLETAARLVLATENRCEDGLKNFAKTTKEGILSIQYDAPAIAEVTSLIDPLGVDTLGPGHCTRVTYTAPFWVWMGTNAKRWWITWDQKRLQQRDSTRSAARSAAT